MAAVGGRSVPTGRQGQRRVEVLEALVGVLVGSVGVEGVGVGEETRWLHLLGHHLPRVEFGGPDGVVSDLGYSGRG